MKCPKARSLGDLKASEYCETNGNEDRRRQ